MGDLGCGREQFGDRKRKRDAMKDPLGFISFSEALRRTGQLDPGWTGDEVQMNPPFDLPPALKESVRKPTKESNETQKRSYRSKASCQSRSKKGPVPGRI